MESLKRLGFSASGGYFAVSGYIAAVGWELKIGDRSLFFGQKNTRWFYAQISGTRVISDWVVGPIEDFAVDMYCEWRNNDKA